jgi:hypothetical protein
MEIQDAIIKANKDGCSFKRECQTEIEYIIDGHDIYPVIIHSKTRLYTPVILHLYDILADDWIVYGQPPQREIVPSPSRQVETLVRQLLSEEIIVKIFLDNEFRCIEEDQTVSVVPYIQRDQYPGLAKKIRQVFIDARQSA